MARFLAGSPPLLQLAAVEAGVDVINEVGMDALRKKSLQLSGYLIKLADEVRMLYLVGEYIRCSTRWIYAVVFIRSVFCRPVQGLT